MIQRLSYPTDTKDVYKSIEDFNLGKEIKVLIVFYYNISDMISFGTHPEVTELLIGSGNFI